MSGVGNRDQPGAGNAFGDALGLLGSGGDILVADDHQRRQGDARDLVVDALALTDADRRPRGPGAVVGDQPPPPLGRSVARAGSPRKVRPNMIGITREATIPVPSTRATRAMRR